MSKILERDLHRIILRPKGSPLAGMIFFHGQGDYIDRYETILQPFTEAGIEIILTDLPGHGRSTGRRGVVPGWNFVKDLLEDSRNHFETNLPLGIAGHSMGGMLALHGYLEQPEHFDFAWCSSPLLDPSHEVSLFKKHGLLTLARIMPWLRVNTGVKASDCRSGDDTATTNRPKGALYHDQISLGWAADLMRMAEDIRNWIPSLTTDRPVLFTQGDADPICPYDLLQDYLEKCSQGQLRFCKIPDGLHEPFLGDTAEYFQEQLQDWITQSLSSVR